MSRVTMSRCLGVTCHDTLQWDVATNLEARGGPVWDHVFVCEKGHYIPFGNLHPAVKVD